MPFVEGGIVVDAEPQQQAAPTATQGGFVQGGIEVDPTPEDSYNKVLQYQAAQTDYTPTKQEYLDYLKVSKEKPLLGERPLETVLTAAGQTTVDIAKMPYRLGEAIGQYIEPPEGVMPMDVAAGTAAEIAIQSRLKAEAMARGGYDVALSNLEKLTGKLRSDDDRYQAFLATSEIKRQLARANAPEDQRVPAAQEFLQAYNIPPEAISQPGTEVGGFLADPSSIAFAGGGKAASALAEQLAQRIPRIAAAVQRGGEAVSRAGEAPERGVGALTTAVTGSPAMGQAVQEAISKGTTGVALGEAAGLPITGTMNVPLLGTASRVIGGTKAAGATLETLGEAGAISGGQTLTPIQRGLLGAGERIAAAEGASAGARAFGTALARSGIEAPAVGAAKILIPAVGAGAAGGLLAGLTGEEGDAIAAAIGSGFAFGAIDSGFRLAKAASSDALNANRVRRTAVDDLNTRPTEVQFTYIDPTTGAEQVVTIKDRESRAKLYGKLNNRQLVKALSEVAGAEAGGAEIIFHSNADTVPSSLQGINYAGVAIGPNSTKSGKPTILINVDLAKPETLPHEILHARITGDVLRQLGSQIIESSVQSPEFQKQFTDFANRYADKLEASGAKVTADRIRTELRDAFDPTQQRAQRIENLKRMTDEFAAYYTQEFLKGKDPKTLLPGRIPSFFELMFNNAREAVSERFTRQALQNGFDPVARTFYDAKGRRIKIDWMEDAIKNLISPKEGFEPTEQRVDTRKMTQAQQNALILARGYSDLFMTAPDGSIVRPLTRAELAAKTADVANRTMKVIETVPQADRTSVSGLDAKGNPIIEGRISLAEADAVSKSGIFSPSTSRYLIDIATAMRDGTLMEGKYWKVYGSTGKAGVFGESEKLFLPYGISINSKGGVNVKAVDWGKVQARMYKALTKPAYKNLFRTYDQAMSTLKDVYLKNIAEQNAVPSSEALGGGVEGAKKRNFFNEVMGAVPKKGDVMINLPTAGYEASRKGGSVYQDLRIERIQNANPTGNKIPWSGDMGEQSSYRRTQLNFQPAERIGETTVQSDQVGGYRIMSKAGKFRLYGPDGSTVGIFDTEGQAKLKAEKDYATQARLQPEVRQQQYPARDEGRQAAEAGRGDRALGRTQGQAEGGAVRQAGDVRFMPEGEVASEKQVAEGLPRRASFEAQGVTRDENGNIFFKGKEPKDWSPKDFEDYGKAFGVPNLGPLSSIVEVPSDVAGAVARIPGGLDGKFTYYDLLWLKANPVDVAKLPETTHAKLTAKLASTMAPTPGDKVASFNSIVFGMLSPNAPLLPNEMGQARLRFGSMDEIRKFAELYPANPTPENLKALNERFKRQLGFIAAGKGGLGIPITADITNIANAARLFVKNPDFFVKRPNESWANFVDKLTTQVKGFGTKTGSFGSVWQDPFNASISAMDRHMARIFGQELLGNPELRKRFDGIVVDRFNSLLAKAKDVSSRFNRKLKTAEASQARMQEKHKGNAELIKQLNAESQKKIAKIKADMASKLDALPDPSATKAKTIDDVLGQAEIYGVDRVQKFVNEAVFAAMGSRKATLLAKKGGVNPNAPEHIKGIDWIETPADFQVMSDAYRSALEINERRAGELGIAVFPAQWTLWDRIRQRVEPHEVMFPGLEKLPALNDRQLADAYKANKVAGYMSTPKAGRKWKRKQIDSPSRLAYFMPAGGEKLYEQTAEQPGRRGDRGEGRYSAGNLAPLAGAPQVQGASGPDTSLVEVAEKYAKDNGINLRRQSEYVDVDEDRARRIAQAYDEMPHAPQDPAVREAYQDLIRQTTDQYRALDSAGYKFWFIDINSDAGQQYASSPFNAMRDLRANKSMGVFPTDSGFGTKEDFNPDSNPMLADTGLRWPFGGPNGELRTVYANDLFRAVHDAFGHGLEGSGFRARGEENAWQAHIRLFTGPARGAITTETRGQNSWLNYGPYGERNRTAKTEDTVFADQKTGLMPEWTWTEGVVGDEPIASQRYMPSDTDYLSAVQKGDTQAAQRMVDEAAKAAGYTIGPVYHGTRADFNKFQRGDLGIHFGTKEQASNRGSTRQIRSFLKGNPLRIDDDPGFWMGRRLIDLLAEKGINKSALIQISNKAANEGGVSGSQNSSADILARGLMDLGIDSIQYPNKFEGSGDSIVVLDPTQIKSADPITYDDAGNVIPLSKRFQASSEDIRFMPDYSGEHRAPGRDSGASLDNLKGVYPDDVYGPNAARYYGDESGSQTDKAAVRIIQATKGKPDAPVKVFRAIPKSIQSNEINPGDWITTIKSYAVKHGEGPLGGDYKILEKTVPAGDLYTDGNSIFEFGYDPKYMPQPDSSMPGAYRFPGGYRALPGKTKGSLRLYGPAGSLIGIASSLEEAQRIIRRKTRP